MIHEQPVKDLSEYTDESSEPDSKQARYKIALVDSCNNEIVSTYHNTILLTSNLGVNSNVNLLWNKYEGFNYSNFEIWRSEDGLNFNFLNSVSNTSTSFIDNNAPNNVFYQIRINNPNQCTSSKRGNYNSVISNIVDKKSNELGLDEIDSRFTIYPNPSNGIFTIENKLVNFDIIIRDINGKELINIANIEGVQTFDFSNKLSKGIYNVYIYQNQ